MRIFFYIISKMFYKKQGKILYKKNFPQICRYFVIFIIDTTIIRNILLQNINRQP